MDFLKTHDARSAAETPIEYHLRFPSTGEPIFDGDKPCIVLLKGASSRSAQEAMRQEEMERIRTAKAAKGKPEEAQAMEDLHKTLCKAAARFIVGFVNMQTTGEDGDMRAMTPEDAPAFLDLYFISVPHLMRAQNAPKRAAGEDDETFAARKEAYAAEWLKPNFAQQIIEAAADDAAFLSKLPKG